MLEFVRILHDGLAKADIAGILNEVNIIDFNYDRSLEQVLFYTLKYSYGVSDQDVASALSNMRIIHPYGYLGKLAWQDAHLGLLGLPFGGELHGPTDIPAVAERIKTFYEQLHDEGDLSAMKSAVLEAERIVFLGFGFHPQNVNMLRPNLRQGATTKVTRIYATAFGESPGGCDVIKQSVVAAMGNQIINVTGQIHVRAIAESW